jgi:hypothetical protein
MSSCPAGGLIHDGIVKIGQSGIPNATPWSRIVEASPRLLPHRRLHKAFFIDYVGS